MAVYQPLNIILKERQTGIINGRELKAEIFFRKMYSQNNSKILYYCGESNMICETVTNLP
jgi:hypothetical protein